MPANYSEVPGTRRIGDEASDDPEEAFRSPEELQKFFDYFCQGVLELDTPNQTIEYWSQKDHSVILTKPNAAFILINNFFIVAHRFLTEGVAGGVKFAKRIYLNTFFVMQCLDKRTPLYEVIEKFTSSASIDEWLSWFPILRKGYQTSETQMEKHIAEALDSTKNVEKLSGGWPGGWLELFSEPQFSICFVATTTTTSRGKPSESRVEYTISGSNLLKWLFRAYSRDKSVALKSLRFACEGRQLFLSSAGKKTAAELGLKDGSVITVSSAQHPSSATDGTAKKIALKKPRGAPSNKKRNQKNKKKAASNQSYSALSEEEKLKQQHSKAMSLVFEECSGSFKLKRQILDSMKLKRTPPKDKSKTSHALPSTAPISNPPPNGLAGKAGKLHFDIQVGEAENLYKTWSTTSFNRNLQSKRIITIDLHGLTKKDALARLALALPKWVDIAMRGEYPWIIPVKIICGRGNQILAEAVKDWIRCNKNAANTPKSLSY